MFYQRTNISSEGKVFYKYRHTPRTVHPIILDSGGLALFFHQNPSLNLSLLANDINQAFDTKYTGTTNQALFLT